MCGFHKKHTWINSSVIVSAKKTGNTSIGKTCSMLKIYSRCLIHILKVKLSIHNLKFLTFQQFRLPDGLLACLPVIKPSFTKARAPVFSHNEGNHVGFTKRCSQEILSTAP